MVAESEFNDQKLRLSKLVRRESLISAILLSVGLTVVLIALYASYSHLKTLNSQLQAKSGDLDALNQKIVARNDQKSELDKQIAFDQKQLSAYANLIPLLAAKLPHGDVSINDVLLMNPNLANAIQRMSIQIANETQRNAAKKITSAMRDRGYTVPGVEDVGSKAPLQSELRFFHKEDGSAGGALTKIQDVLTSLGLKAQLVFVPLKSTQAVPPPNQYELWIASSWSPGN